MKDKKDKDFSQEHSSIQNIIDSQIKKIEESDTGPKYEYDRLKMYFGDDYIIKVHNGGSDISIRQPKIQDFLDYGEGGEKYIWSSLTPFLSNSTSYRLVLWEMGIDWNKVNDYQFFGLTRFMMNPEYTKCVFGDLDFTKMQEMKKEDDQIVYLDPENKILIDEEVYTQIKEYLRYMLDVHPKVELTRSKSAKQDIILEEKMNEARKKKEKKDESSSMLLPKISFCLNHPGFKYKKNELRDVGIFEFLDSVQRLQIYESTSALYKGMYSGFVDTKKINKENFNFMRDYDQA